LLNASDTTTNFEDIGESTINITKKMHFYRTTIHKNLLRSTILDFDNISDDELLSIS